MQAVRSESKDASLIGHLSDCETCRDAVAADTFMQALDKSPLVTHSLPAPSILWIKAQLLQQQETGARLTQRMQLLQALPLGLIAVLWAIVLSWKWTSVYPALQHFSLKHVLSSSALGANPLPMSVVMLFAVMIGLTVVVSLHGVFAEE